MTIVSYHKARQQESFSRNQVKRSYSHTPKTKRAQMPDKNAGQRRGGNVGLAFWGSNPKSVKNRQGGRKHIFVLTFCFFCVKTKEQ